MKTRDELGTSPLNPTELATVCRMLSHIFGDQFYFNDTKDCKFDDISDIAGMRSTHNSFSLVVPNQHGILVDINKCIVNDNPSGKIF
jgi:hypothetical protein